MFPRRFAASLTATAVLLAILATGTAAAGLTETGSSLLYPILVTWIADYTKAKPDVHIDAESTGSGYGIEQARSGAVSFGGSDAYVPDALAKEGVVNVPLAVSAQEVAYNIPGLGAETHLKLGPDALAAIYSGSVKYWDDAAVASANRDVKLPHARIVPIRRSDKSGDTFLFTQYLSADARWKAGPGSGTSIAWPAVDGEQTAQHNAGMVQLCANAPGCIAYVGISFFEQARASHLGYAALRNRAGRYILPTPAAIAAAAKTMATQTPPDARISLIDAPGADSYPIVNFEYAILAAHARDSKDVAAFLTWAIAPAGGNAERFLDPVHFVALPPQVRKISEALIARSTGG